MLAIDGSDQEEEMKAFIIVTITLLIIVAMFVIGMRGLRGRTSWDRVPKDQRKKVIISGAIISIFALILMIGISAIGKNLNPLSGNCIWDDNSVEREAEEKGKPPVSTSEGYILDDTVIVPVPEGFVPELEYDDPTIEFIDNKSGDVITVRVDDQETSTGEYSHYTNYSDGSVKTDLGTFFYNTYNKDGTPDSEKNGVPMYSIHGMLKYENKMIFTSVSSQKPDEKYVEILTDHVRSFKPSDR